MSKADHTPDFKKKVLLELENTDTTQKSIATKFGISTKTLGNWKKQANNNIIPLNPNKPGADALLAVQALLKNRMFQDRPGEMSDEEYIQLLEMKLNNLEKDTVFFKRLAMHFSNLM